MLKLSLRSRNIEEKYNEGNILHVRNIVENWPKIWDELKDGASHFEVPINLKMTMSKKSTKLGNLQFSCMETHDIY